MPGLLPNVGFSGSSAASANASGPISVTGGGGSPASRIVTILVIGAIALLALVVYLKKSK